MTVFKTMFNST